MDCSTLKIMLATTATVNASTCRLSFRLPLPTVQADVVEWSQELARSTSFACRLSYDWTITPVLGRFVQQPIPRTVSTWLST